MNTATVFVEDSFDSAHWLPRVPRKHKCRRLHGHTYSIRLEITGMVDPATGWVRDYAEIKKAWNKIKDQLDHHHLNDLPGLDNPTCEVLSRWIFDRLKSKLPLTRIELRETHSCGVLVEGR